MIALVLGAAWAYELTGLDWAWQAAPLEFPIVLDVDSFPAGFATEADLEANIIEATAAWSDSRADFAVEYGGLVSGPQPDVVRVHYVDSTPGDLLGAAQVLAIGTSMDSCSIEVYRANRAFPEIPWSFAPDAADLPFERYDFQTVLVHELGHCFGLNHSEYEEAVMYFASYNGVARRELHPDDEDGLVALYGRAAGCSTLGTTGRMPVIALLAGLLARSRRKRS